MKSRIKELRKRRYLTQSGLGMKLGVSQQNISRYEQDPFSVPVDMLIKMADFFHVSIDYLLGVSDFMPFPAAAPGLRTRRQKEEENDLLELYRTLEKRDKEIIWAVIEILRKYNRSR